MFLLLFQYFEEIPANGLYCVDLRLEGSEQDYKQSLRINKFDWKHITKGTQDRSFLMCPVALFNKQMPNEQDSQVIEENRRRFCPQKKGEMDENFGKERETLVAQDSCVQSAVGEKHVVDNNISSLEIVENKTLEDCASGLNTMFSSFHTTSSTRNTEVNVPKVLSCHESAGLLNSESSQDCCVEMSSDILARTEASGRTKGSSESSLHITKWNSTFNEARDKFIVVLGEAVKKRVFNLPRTDSDSVSQGSQEASSNLTGRSVLQEQRLASSSLLVKDARVGILFSGGIDSMMIAALADK